VHRIVSNCVSSPYLSSQPGALFSDSWSIEVCCAVLQLRFVDLVALINRFRAMADHSHSSRTRDTGAFEIANCGPAKIVGYPSYYTRVARKTRNQK
jgi:hypothetical protein